MRRLGLPFQCVAPEVDEYVEAGEEPERRAIRLARLKAQSAASTRLTHLVCALVRTKSRVLGTDCSESRGLTSGRPSSLPPPRAIF